MKLTLIIEIKISLIIRDIQAIMLCLDAEKV